MNDLSLSPVLRLSWTNDRIKEHLDKILELDGAKIMFGGKPLTNHKVPSIYGAFEATCVFVPIKHFKGRKAKLLLLSITLY